MNIDGRKLLSVTILPLVLMLVSFYCIPLLAKPMPDVLHVIFPFIPFIIFTTGVSLSLVFHHSREFNTFILLAILYISLNHFIWTTSSDVDYKFAYLLLSILIPANYLFNLLAKDRGILNQFGLKRIIILGAQLYVIYLLLTNPYQPLKNFLSFTYFNFEIFQSTDTSLIIFIAITATFFTILYKLLETPTILTSSIFFSFISITMTMHFYKDPQLATIFVILAASLILISITTNAYSLAYLDELTSLPSRRALSQTMTTLGKRYCIAMVDVDHFKKFNDKYGHDIGDQVLKKLAAQLRKVRGGKAFRYGGEEFTIVFANKDLHESRLACEDLCKNVENDPFLLRNKKRPKLKNGKMRKQVQAIPLTITVSVGVAERSETRSTADRVIKKADKVLYKAKENGRNQVST